MSQTVIAFGDVKAQKKWSGNLAVDVIKKSYFTKKFVGKGDNFVIQQKTELESDAGDVIKFDLSVQLRGKPIYGDDIVDGTEEGLRFYQDQVNIDQVRKAVSAGGRMSRKRTVHNLRKTGKDRLGDYFSSYMDEVQFIYLAGARGINQDFKEEISFTGFANNSIEPPDAQHLLYGGAGTSKASITSADVMSVQAIEKACVTARMMQAKDPEASNMMPVSIDGEPHYVTIMSPFQEYDMRTDAGAGWMDVQKAAAAANGKNNPIFKGGLGMINNVVLHSHTRSIRFNDYGAGANLSAARALFMGRQAGVVAYGTANKNMRFEWVEETKDAGNQHNVISGAIFGCKKTRFNGRDFGVLAIDTYATDPLV